MSPERLNTLEQAIAELTHKLETQPAHELTEERMEEIAQRAVIRVLATLGINAESIEGVNELRDDFRFNHRLRKNSSRLGMAVAVALITTSVSGLIYVAAIGIKNLFHH